MKKSVFICFVFVMVCAFSLSAQEQEKTLGMIDGEDTLIFKEIKEIWIYPERKFRNKRQEKEFWRYANRVRKVYPYARAAGELLMKYEPEYASLPSQKERRQFMNRIEDELMERYKDELKKLTVSEGRILIRLVDRETSRTAYSIVKDFRGDLAAFFWQAIAKIFGNNLKDVYDPYGEDRLTEEIVRLIEIGYL